MGFQRLCFLKEASQGTKGGAQGSDIDPSCAHHQNSTQLPSIVPLFQDTPFLPHPEFIQKIPFLFHLCYSLSDFIHGCGLEPPMRLQNSHSSQPPPEVYMQWPLPSSSSKLKAKLPANTLVQAPRSNYSIVLDSMCILSVHVCMHHSGQKH